MQFVSNVKHPLSPSLPPSLPKKNKKQNNTSFPLPPNFQQLTTKVETWKALVAFNKQKSELLNEDLLVPL